MKSVLWLIQISFLLKKKIPQRLITSSSLAATHCKGIQSWTHISEWKPSTPFDWKATWSSARWWHLYKSSWIKSRALVKHDADQENDGDYTHAHTHMAHAKFFQLWQQSSHQPISLPASAVPSLSQLHVLLHPPSCSLHVHRWADNPV